MEIKTTQMRANKAIYLELAIARGSATTTKLTFGRVSKTERGGDKLYSEKRKSIRYAQTDVAVGGILCDCFGEQICLSLIGLDLGVLV